VWVARDVTAEAALEVRLREAVVGAEAASRAKSEFLSRMSHELRSPLNLVLGFAQVLELDDLAPAQDEAVGHILRAGRHLLDLIDEVLDIDRIESGLLHLDLGPVGVDEVVGDAVNLTWPLAERAGVAVDVSLPRGVAGSQVLGDRQRLLQVLLNLLTNAVRYNRSGGRVEVVGERLGDRLRLRVTDTGPGIPSEAMEGLFEPYVRGQGRSFDGVGVGLSLSRQLMERMGGTIGASSEPGRGSTFTVELPLSTESAPAREAAGRVRPEPRPGPGGGPPFRVLCVEDNADNLALVGEILGRLTAVELLGAADGASGLGLARGERPDLVLLDLHLPDMTGEELLDRLRAEPELAGIPVVVVSADATAGQRRRLEERGVAAYLTKPIEVGRLLDLVEGLRPGGPR
jgi:CheY-like chemotaxis protein/anti-sigma regulatory factor (Ser/Thr protein kinase)